jgi:hypothetical protein
MKSFCSGLNMKLLRHGYWIARVYTAHGALGNRDLSGTCLGTPFTASAFDIDDQTRSRTMHKEQGHTVETPVEARAGFLDRPVLVVLVVAVFLVCLLFAAVYMGFFAR